MSGDLATLCTETPSSSHGIATGHGNYKLVVEAAIPDQTYALWDVSKWGVGKWSDGYEWHDLSSLFRGASWSRGRAGIQGRPETGEAAISLANNDGTLSYWNTGSTYPSAPLSLKPGTLVRIAWTDTVAGIWEPAFTGILDEAEEAAAERDGDLWTTWHLIETTGLLSLIDDAALIAEEGSGETGEDRMDRLLTAAGWPYGKSPIYAGVYLLGPWGAETLQATTMAANRLADCYLTADTVFADVYSDRNGRIQFQSKDAVTIGTQWDNGIASVYGVSEDAGTVAGTLYIPWTQAPSITTSNLDRYDSVTAGRANGNSATSVATGDVVRSSYKRTDLLNDSDTNLQAWADTWIDVFAGNVVKVSDVGLDAHQGTNVMDAIAHLDAPLLTKLRRTNPRQTSGYTDATFSAVLTGYTVDVTPNGPQKMSVTASLSVAVYTIT